MRGTGIAVIDTAKLRLREGDEYCRLINGEGDVIHALRRYIDPARETSRIDGARVLQAAAGSDEAIQNLVDAGNDTPILTMVHVKKIAHELKRLHGLEQKVANKEDLLLRAALVTASSSWPRTRASALPQLASSSWSSSLSLGQGSGGGGGGGGGALAVAAPAAATVSLEQRADALLAVSSSSSSSSSSQS